MRGAGLVDEVSPIRSLPKDMPLPICSVHGGESRTERAGDHHMLWQIRDVFAH